MGRCGILECMHSKMLHLLMCSWEVYVNIQIIMHAWAIKTHVFSFCKNDHSDRSIVNFMLLVFAPGGYPGKDSSSEAVQETG